MRFRARAIAHLAAEVGRRCARCGATERLELDHVVPLGDGGADDLANVQLLCAVCHAAKTAAERRRALMPEATRVGDLRI